MQRGGQCRGVSRTSSLFLSGAQDRLSPSSKKLISDEQDQGVKFRSQDGGGSEPGSGVQWGRVEDGSGCELLLLLLLLKAPSLGPQPLTLNHLLQEEARKDPSPEPSETAWPY